MVLGVTINVYVAVGIMTVSSDVGAAPSQFSQFAPVSKLFVASVEAKVQVTAAAETGWAPPKRRANPTTTRAQTTYFQKKDCAPITKRVKELAFNIKNKRIKKVQ
jgi:hypothetical protein